MSQFIFKRTFVLLISCLLSIHLSAQESDTLKVLFVGNSYTYFWNLPQTVSALAASQGVPIKTRKSNLGGATLKEHWEGERNLKTRTVIEEGQWDVVILQNHSKSTLETYEEFMDYGKKFIAMVKDRQAAPLLYMTWAREFNPLMQEKISEGYRTLARETDADLAAVGEVWKKARELRPDLNLFDPDGSHPSTIGTYLTACVFFKVLTGKTTLGLPSRLSDKDKDGEEIFLTIINDQDAQFIQQLVDNMVTRKVRGVK